MNDQELHSRRTRIVSSALWAAYGDALGFPTELATPETVRRRLGTDEALTTSSWSRMVGGRFGVVVKLPIGAYSDDTQLRLATSRAIRGDGDFDVESFAKVELPVWLSYCLGAGRGSKAAAASLSSKSVTWFSNFFSSDGIKYIFGGGNGAAMRVQPHVWSAVPPYDDRSIAAAVLRDAVCTHGHLRGISGAIVHAASLAHTLRLGSVPDIAEWPQFAKIIELIPELVSLDSELATFWQPTWEREASTSIAAATRTVAMEWIEAVELASKTIRHGDVGSYRQALVDLGGISDAERGSGIKCSLFALLVAWAFQDSGVAASLQVAANTLGSDTDSVASMAGALLGATTETLPPKSSVQDWRYIAEEAERMFRISVGAKVPCTPYPDLLHWHPPRTALDSIVRTGDSLALAGLGKVEPIGEDFFPTTKGSVWSWYRLAFGQTILCKRRDSPKEIQTGNEPRPIYYQQRTSPLARSSMKQERGVPDLFGDGRPKGMHLHDERTSAKSSSDPTLEDLTDIAIRSQFDPETIGTHLVLLSSRDKGLELVIAYGSIIAKAIRARQRKSR